MKAPGIFAIAISIGLLAGCNRPSAPTPAPPSAPSQPATSVEPPPTPDIGLGSGGGWTLEGNAPSFGSGTTLGSGAFGTVSAFQLTISTNAQPIDVTRVDLPIGTHTISLNGPQNTTIAWSLDGTQLSQCTDNCAANTLPSSMEFTGINLDANFSYWPVGASTSSQTTMRTFRSLAVTFQ